MNLQAEKIKIQRKKVGLTIKELAKKIGYTDAYISQIENGKVVPSIKVLKKIVDTLDLSFRDILISNSQQEKFFFKKSEYLEIRRQNNSIEEKLLCSNLSFKKMQPTYKIIKPNTECIINLKPKDEKFGYILKGTIELDLDNKIIILNEHDSFYITYHNYITIKNTNTINAELICVDLPPNI
ncbi:transcriptional regulator, XRE family with cupin sensor [Desulfurella multipotens]|uniref:Transcriptional regulator, XRE family with cupin sensor n=1 Tax=Desulfurella multipotens TaxID=79269 RepID=A0A1G6L012_9BACT|nr:helix-turn-helix transcriptional regulator [Desulfurella multipotens]SDC36055.1 transcriptional regulator, XRE family with cupin sensor [Desulfurella multipotens]